MDKIAQTSGQLEIILSEKWQSLEHSCELYDSGKSFAALNLAADLRLLLHDTKQSISLLQQLDKKKVPFYDSTTLPPGKLVGPYIGLYGIPVGGSDPRYIPYLDGGPNHKKRCISFDSWWNQVVICDAKGQKFTRKDIVTYVADQGGGAHVDPSLDKNYSGLSQSNSLGWKTFSNNETEKNIQDGDRAAIRQIAHEVLRTFLPNYPVKEFSLPRGTIALAGMIGVAFSAKEAFSPGRNSPCPCGALKEDGSRRKYKKCHGA